MRLSPKRIETLARVICRSLEQSSELQLVESPEKATQLIRQVIAEDIRLEEEIEDEARRLLDEHKNEIDRKGASYDSLLRKTKSRLAQERKMVL